MPLKLTTQLDKAEIEVLPIGSPGQEVQLRITMPDNKIKRLGKADEIIPGQKINVNLGLSDLDHLVHMLRST